MQNFLSLLFSVAHFLLLLFPCSLLAQHLHINELVSSNTLLEDTYGDKPDWIELYNSGDTAINLANYKIGDDPDVGLAWEFPGGSIQPGGPFAAFCFWQKYP